MRTSPLRPIASLATVAISLGCGSSSAPSHAAQNPGAAPSLATGRRMVAAFNDGTIHVYDMDQGHAELTSFATVSGVRDVRGLCAAAPTGMLFMSHMLADAGHVVAIDLARQAVVWDRAFQPNTDRLSCLPDGSKLYVPSNESFTDDALIVVDAATGDELRRIPISPRPHDSVPSLSGDHVYIETKSSNLIDVVDTATDTVIKQIGPFADIGGPFTVDSRETRVYGNFYGVDGFQIGDVVSGAVLATTTIVGQTAVPGELDQHGIALSPDETELWVNDGVAGLAAVHVFDVTQTAPVAKLDVALDFSGPHWITFSIAGDFAYVAGQKLAGMNTDVIDAVRHVKVGTIGPSEDLLEVDTVDGVVSRVGSQFGVGRESP
jgi:DNA-binding beta-propeller fold protein YncE